MIDKYRIFLKDKLRYLKRSFDSVQEAVDYANEKELGIMDFEIVKEKDIKIPLEKYDLTDDETGKKYDEGKSMVGTLCQVFSRALLGVGKCITFGATKYPTVDNWCKVENGKVRYLDALMRHLLKHLAGEEKDPETGLPHLFHVCWNALAVTEFYLKDHPELDKELFI